MATNEGFPPGWDFRKPQDQKGYKPEHQRRTEKQNSTIQQLSQMLPNNMQDMEPVVYDEHGAPIIEEFFDGEELVEIRQPQQPKPQTRAPQQQRNVRPPAAAPQSRPQMPPNIPFKAHPVVEKMLTKFGLKQAPKLDFEVFFDDGSKFVYTMQPIPEELTLWALNESKDFSIVRGQLPATARFQLLLSCCAVIAIDHEPVWKIFKDQIDFTPEESHALTSDEYNMPYSVRKKCAKALTDLIWYNMHHLGDQLFEFYESKIIPLNKPKNSLDQEYENAQRYVCPVDGCNFYLIKKPKTDPETGEDMPYFCQDHGEMLILNGPVKDEDDLPLV
jgi:hypothetical protein